MSITYFRLQLDSTDERWSPLWPVSKEPRHTYLNDIRKLSGLESCVKFYSNKLEGFMTKLNHSSTDVIVCCVKFYSNRLECFLTKLNHSSTEFTDETLNKTLCWEEQGSHPITTQNKSSHSQHWVRPPLASVQAWLALFLLMSTRAEQAGKLSLTQCRRGVLKLVLSVQSMQRITSGPKTNFSLFLKPWNTAHKY